MIQTRVRESRNLDQALQEIEPKLSRNILRTAVRAGGNVVRDEARTRIRSRSGRLRRQIRTVVRRGRPGQTVASVGVFTRGRKDDAFYAPFVERGHRIVPRRPKGARVRLRTRWQVATGFVRPYPFLLPALAAKQAEVQRVVMEHIASRLSELV